MVNRTVLLLDEGVAQKLFPDVQVCFLGRNIRDLTNELAQEGYEVVIVVPQPDYGYYRYCSGKMPCRVGKRWRVDIADELGRGGDKPDVYRLVCADEPKEGGQSALGATAERAVGHAGTNKIISLDINDVNENGAKPAILKLLAALTPAEVNLIIDCYAFVDAVRQEFTCAAWRDVLCSCPTLIMGRVSPVEGAMQEIGMRFNRPVILSFNEAEVRRKIEVRKNIESMLCLGGSAYLCKTGEEYMKEWRSKTHNRKVLIVVSDAYGISTWVDCDDVITVTCKDFMGESYLTQLRERVVSCLSGGAGNSFACVASGSIPGAIRASGDGGNDPVVSSGQPAAGVVDSAVAERSSLVAVGQVACGGSVPRIYIDVLSLKDDISTDLGVGVDVDICISTVLEVIDKLLDTEKVEKVDVILVLDNIQICERNRICSNIIGAGKLMSNSMRAAKCKTELAKCQDGLSVLVTDNVDRWGSDIKCYCRVLGCKEFREGPLGDFLRQDALARREPEGEPAVLTSAICGCAAAAELN